MNLKQCFQIIIQYYFFLSFSHVCKREDWEKEETERKIEHMPVGIPADAPMPGCICGSQEQLS